tara:strand:- start:10 stop:216 length:207 start_codon:yes stop_codon:yes gene_type:complete
MKVKLLKKVRKQIKIVKRNNIHYLIKKGKLIDWEYKTNGIKNVNKDYRIEVIILAREIFGIKYKKVIK